MKAVIAVAVLLLSVAGRDVAIAQTQPAQERVDLALARAREAGIPLGLLENKIAEGRAKGVSIDRIAAALERREALLERANQALRGRPDVSAADLSVTADALDTGVSEAVLRAIADSAPRERRAAAIAALTELVALGDAPDTALGRVREALKHGPEALANLPAEAAARRGGSSGHAPESTSGGAGKSGDGGGVGPPAGVPAPGKSPEPKKPGGPPANPGNSGSGKSNGRGGA